MSRKAQLNDPYFDPIPFQGPILTKHARERCKQRHINPLHIGLNPSTNAQFGSRTSGDQLVVATVYKNPPTEFVRKTRQRRTHHTTEDKILGHRRTRRDYGGHVIDGEEHMRKTHRAVCVPKDVLVHLKKISKTKKSCHEAQTKTKAQMKSDARAIKHQKKLDMKREKRRRKQEIRYRSKKGLKNRL